MYSLPSTSHTRAPLPLAMNGGVPSTARNERTGLLTPPGMTRWAWSKSCWDLACSILCALLGNGLRRRNQFSGDVRPLGRSNSWVMVLLIWARVSIIA